MISHSSQESSWGRCCEHLQQWAWQGFWFPTSTVGSTQTDSHQPGPPSPAQACWIQPRSRRNQIEPARSRRNEQAEQLQQRRGWQQERHAKAREAEEQIG